VQAVKSEPPLVLVVDDIESARLVCERRLKQAGYRVISVANVAAALIVLRTQKVIHAQPVAAVIADLNLGRSGGDGLALLKAVGQWWPKTVRILWPANAFDCELARDAGIACCEKTGHYFELLSVLAEELGMSPPGAP
jgi:DNA-binding NtrC family response regulator